MKLKLLFLLAFFQLFYFSGSAQYSDGCHQYADPAKPSPSFEQVEKFVQQRPNARLEAAVTIPVQLHFVVGKSGSKQDLDVVKAQFVDLNTKFLPAGIQFSICNSVNYINNAKYDSLIFLYDHFELSDRYNSPNTIDIFYVGYIEGAAGFFSNFASEDGILAIRNNTGGAKTLIHEMGHYFGLDHTHDASYGRENVDGSNCSYTGDKICDTPADPNLLGVSLPNCVYSGTVKDSKGQLYKPDVTNYMSYASSECINSFTKQQYDRIMYTYQNTYLPRYNYVCNNLPDFSASVDRNLNKMDKGKNNTVKLAFFNFSSATFSSNSVGYKLYLVDVFNTSITLSTGVVSPTVTPSFSDSMTVSVFIPTDLADGAYTLSLQIDPTNTFPEILENNNIGTQRVAIFTSGKALPDLEMKATGTEYTYAGYEYAQNISLKNIGNFDSPQTSFRTYVSRDNQMSIDDRIDGPYYYPTAVPNQGFNNDDYRILLTDTINKSFYVIQVVDQEDNILESNENNNVVVTKVTTIAAPAKLAKPDYALSDMTFTSGSSTLQRNQRAILAGSIDNLGDTTTYLVAVASYFSTDNVWDASDIKTYQAIERVYNTKNVRTTFSATVPKDAPLGQGYLIIVVDPLRQLVEKNENNNTLVIPVTVVADQEPLLDFNTFKLNTTLWYYGNSWQFDTQLKNVGLTSTKIQMLSFYLTKEKVFDYYRNSGKSLGSTGWDYQALAPQATKEYTYSLPVLDSEINPGAYYMTVCALYTSPTLVYGKPNCMMLTDKVIVGHKPLGIEEEEMGYSSFVVYPNPASDQVTVQSSMPIQHVEIVSQTGAILKSSTAANAPESLVSFSVSELPKGIYFVKLYGQVHTQVQKMVLK